jgi:hypothetical protein
MAIRCTIAVVMCACLATVVEAKPQGALGLDSLTFDKVVDGSRDILVSALLRHTLQHINIVLGR